MDVRLSHIVNVQPLFLLNQDSGCKIEPIENIGLIKDVWVKIFSSLSSTPKLALSLVNKELYMIGKPFAKLAKLAFDKEKWCTYFGDIGEELLLPEEIYQILESPCPFWAGKKVEDTHILIQVPITINDIPLTMVNLGEIVKQPKQGNASQYSGLHLGEYKDISPSKSYWLLITKYLIEGTQCKSNPNQKKILNEFRQKTGLPYEVPHPLDVALSLFMTYASTGVRLYSDGQMYIRCQGAYNAKYQLCVGSFKANGVFVDFVGKINNRIGSAYCRKFFLISI